MTRDSFIYVTSLTHSKTLKLLVRERAQTHVALGCHYGKGGLGKNYSSTPPVTLAMFLDC